MIDAEVSLGFQSNPCQSKFTNTSTSSSGLTPIIESTQFRPEMEVQSKDEWVDFRTPSNRSIKEETTLYRSRNLTRSSLSNNAKNTQAKSVSPPNIFVNSEILSRLRDDDALSTIFRVLSEEFVKTLSSFSKYFVMRAYVSADPEEENWTRYVISVDIPNSSWDEKMSIWNKLSASRQSARNIILSQYNKSPRTRTLQELERVKVHINLSR